MAVLGLAAAAVLAGCAAPTTATTSPGPVTAPAGDRVEVELGTRPDTDAGTPPGSGPAPGAPGDVGITTQPAAGGDVGATSVAWEPVVVDASVPVGPENDCAGVDQSTTDVTRLIADDQVSEIVVCGAGLGYVPGDGTWNLVTEHRVPAARLPALVDGLRRADVVSPPDTACTLILVMVPTFTVVTTDGRRLKGSVPSDGCHPQEDVVGLIDQVVADQPAEQRWRTTRVQTEAELTTSCPPETTAVSWPPVGRSDDSGTAPVPVQVPPDGAGDGAALCRYEAPTPAEGQAAGLDEPTGVSTPAPPEPVSEPSGGDGMPSTSPGVPPLATAPLGGSGSIDAALRDRMVASIVTTAPADRPGCSAGAPWTVAADGTGQLVLATPPVRTTAGVPQPGYPYLVLESGSCSRVLVDGGYSLAGWADPGIVAEIRAAVGG